MKAHQVAAVAPEVGSILGPRTLVLTAQNGIPWWYFFKHGGPREGVRLESVDPRGVIADHLPIDRVVATVVYPAAEIERPGVVRHVEGQRFSLAEIDGAKTDRLAAISQIFTEAGFKAPVVADVRTEIWTKLLGNLTFNPISALTHALLEDICRFPPTRTLAMAMMREALAVAEAFGVRDPIDRLRLGGLPPVLLGLQQPDAFFPEWLDSYFARDIQKLFHVQKRTAFLSVLAFLMRQSGGLLDISKVARAAEVSRPTVMAWLDVYQTTHTVHVLRPFSGGGRREIIAQPKVYGFDTGLVCHQRGWDRLRPDDCGILWEHVVLDRSSD